MKQGRVTKVALCVAALLVAALRTVLFAGVSLFVLGIVLIAYDYRPFGNQKEGEYYVERINAVTNTYESENYYYVTEVGARCLYSYMPDTQKWEDVLGLEHVLEFAVAGDKLYVRVGSADGSKYWMLDEMTGEKQLLKGKDIKYTKELLSMKANSSDSQKIETVLSDEEYNYTYVFIEDLDYSEDTVIGLTQVPVNPRYAGELIVQKGLKYDILFSYDPKTENCEILYRPRTNRTRIIGYQDGYVYLYKKNRIIRECLEDGASEVIAKIPKGKHYTFDWWKEYLVVIDHETDELVTMVKCF